MIKYILTYLLVPILAACGSNSLTGTDGPRLTEQAVGFQMQLVGDGVAGAGLFPAQAADGTLTVTSAVVNVAAIELDAPDGWDCSRYNLAVESSDDHADDDSTDDQSEGVTEHTDDEKSLSGTLRPQAGDHGTTVRGTCTQDEGHAEIEFAGPFRVNLLTGESVPALEDLAIPPGTYQRIALEVDDVEDGVSPDHPLFGRSLLAFGTYATETASPMRITLRMGEEIRYEAPDSSPGITIGAAGGEDIVVSISTNQWFDGVASEIDACIDEAATDDAPSPFLGGTLVLDDESDVDSSEDCADQVADLLEENFKGAGQLARQ